MPVPEVYAGAMFWPIERAAEVLAAWRAWVDTVPEACESLGRMLQLPDVPFLPEQLRGQSFVLVEAAIIGTAEEGEALVRPLRDLGPAMDTMAMLPTSQLSTVNMDPDFPLPYSGEGLLLTDVTGESIERLVDAFVGSPLLHVEIRHLGGALARRSPDHGVLDAIDEPFLAFTFGLTPDEASHEAVERQVAAVFEAFAALGQRPALPELRGVEDGSAPDLPARVVRAVPCGQGPLRPDRPVPGQPLGRGARPGLTAPSRRGVRRPERRRRAGRATTRPR